MVTKSAELEYIKSEGNFCPYCKSPLIEPCGDVEYCGNATYTEHIVCGECGKDWDDIYTLVGIRPGMKDFV